MFYGRGQGGLSRASTIPNLDFAFFGVCQGLAGNGTEIQGILEFVVVDIVPHDNENLYVLVVIMRSRIHGLGPNFVTAL